MTSYNTSSIKELDQIDHIRKNPNMYIGSSETPTKLLEECIDNALDEAQAGYADIIAVKINSTISVIDNGRGIPFDDKLDIEKDPPIAISTRLFTSGKFDKDKNDNYKVSAGLHGIGLTAVYALSKYVKYTINRGNKCGVYYLDCDKKIIQRDVQKTKETPFSTKIEFEPNPKFFESTEINIEYIKERLKFACFNLPFLKVVFMVYDNNIIIDSNESMLLKEYLSPNSIKYFNFEIKKGIEKCRLIVGWDFDSTITSKIFGCVNLINVNEGVHILKLKRLLKDFFSDYLSSYEFQVDDIMAYLRSFINLSIIKTSFEAQSKVKLGTDSDISIMDLLIDEIKSYFKNNKSELDILLNKFQEYRRSLKIGDKSIIKKGRVLTKFSKLSDCSSRNGELIIGEGDSAVGGLLQVRDVAKHAILPLKGVIANAVTKRELLENLEVKDIIIAVGTGIENNCDISKIRYDKIIIATDADPAGRFIAVLLIVLFAKLFPSIIKEGFLYLAETPLFTTKRNGKLIPLWTDSDIEKAKNKKEDIKRNKGLGGFVPKDLKELLLNEKNRKLIKIEWSADPEKIFKLVSSAEEKRNLLEEIEVDSLSGE